MSTTLKLRCVLPPMSLVAHTTDVMRRVAYWWSVSGNTTMKVNAILRTLETLSYGTNVVSARCVDFVLRDDVR